MPGRTFPGRRPGADPALVAWRCPDANVARTAATIHEACSATSTFHSDWKKGSTYEMAHDDVGLVVSGPDQVILESHLPHRLAYTWHTITPVGRGGQHGRGDRRGLAQRSPLQGRL